MGADGLDRAEGLTAADAGWRLSRYILAAPLAGGKVAVANLFAGSVCELTPLEVSLAAGLDQIPECHPVLERLAARNVICRFDELAALEAQQRIACASAGTVRLVICPTMGCNFDCPYCFERHDGHPMPERVQDDVVGLAGRMLGASCARELSVGWFGGEPLLALDVIRALTPRLRAAARAHGASYRAGVTTNGYLLAPSVARELAGLGVTRAQVTVDGIGPTHDATRHLAGGGATFDRIMGNLSQPGLPFAITVRANVHAGNLGQVDELRELVARTARESGNDVGFLEELVTENDASTERGGAVGILQGAYASVVEAGALICLDGGRRVFRCQACGLWDANVDADGLLYKCPEAVGRPELSFASAGAWDPAKPLATASDPDNLSRYLNLGGPAADPECRACVWLPVCEGGCPKRRLEGARQCLACKDHPEEYVLALHERRFHMTGPKEERRARTPNRHATRRHRDG